MSFTSWQYALFLPAIVLLYWSLPHRGRVWLLLGANYLFYGAWDARFLALLLTSTTIDFFCGLAIAQQQKVAWTRVAAAAAVPALWLAGCALATRRADAVDAWIVGSAVAFPFFFTTLYQALWRLPRERRARAFLLLSVLSNLVVLGFFKYFNFFAASALALCAKAGWDPGWTLPHVILPVAISFYTFQSIAYSVDIYRGKADPVRNYVTFAAYLSFFPQLVAGPIERPRHLVTQFVKPAEWSSSHVQQGLRLILVGLFKKIFVADNCALLVMHAFDVRTPLNAPWALLGVVAFAFQIYGDFSGYTDIARGSARLLGFHLSQNFLFPYFARGPSDFWQRWHITLSSWFRDYVYIPLGGNRGSRFATLRNLMLTMLLAGLWHGANWTYVLWGAYHGGVLVLYRVVPTLQRLSATAAVSSGRVPASMALMTVFTLAGWAIFRCENLVHLGAWFSAWTQWNVPGAIDWVKPGYWLTLHAVPLLALQAATWRTRDEADITHLHWAIRGVIYALLFLAVASSAVADVEFIYFQF